MIFKFEPCELIGGAWTGIYAAESDDEVYALDTLIKSGNKAVKEITKESYDQLKKKAAQRLNGYATWGQEQPVQAQSPVEVVASSVVLTPDSIKTAKVVPAQPQQPPTTRRRKSIASDASVATIS